MALETVDSTNSEAGRQAATASAQLWITAETQTAGRGRRGKPWLASGAPFAATLLIPDPGPADQAMLRSFVAALALADVFSLCGVADDQIGLKWPNDVLLKGRKIAGILLESATHKDGSLAHLAIGIGVNLASAPDPAGLPKDAVAPISLADVIGGQIEAASFLTFLASAYDKREAQFRAYGFGPIRTAWLDKAVRMGEVITARTSSEEITGRFETVDEAGHLMLRTAKEMRAISAAEIFF